MSAGCQPVEAARVGQLGRRHRLELHGTVGRRTERVGQLRGTGEQGAGVVDRLQIEEVLRVLGDLRGLEEQGRGA